MERESLGTMKKSCNAEEKLDRKTVERNRRIHMKGLCFKLASLIPPPHDFKSSKDMLSRHDQLDHEATYIKKLKERIEDLKETKRRLLEMDDLKEINNNNNNNSNFMNNNSTTMMFGPKLPLIELRDTGSSLEVVLISSALHKNLVSIYDIITILEQAGAEVVSASFSSAGHKIFHSLHAQVKIARVGMDTSRIHQKLQELVN